MDVTPLVREGAKIIQSYAGGTFRISGAVYEGPVIIFPDSVETWAVSGDLSAGDFSVLERRARELDVVLAGTGKFMTLLKPDLRRALREMGLSVEFMDTGAACRTYNVLLAEGRRVAAALLPV